jgi:hypothetical protein
MTPENEEPQDGIALWQNTKEKFFHLNYTGINETSD